jgi:tetratricopeptide (TPR) repeat protein
VAERVDRSAHINGSVTDSPIFTGDNYGNITFNYQQLQRAQAASQSIKRPEKPSSFFEEKTGNFVGRKQEIKNIKELLLAGRNNESNKNVRVSIVGEGGIGKSALAFEVIDRCTHAFNIIIDINFESRLTFDSFLLEMARKMNIPLNEFEKIDNKKQKEEVIKYKLADKKYRRALVYADNYETISDAVNSNTDNAYRADAVEINGFMESLPRNTAILLTSRRQAGNLEGEIPKRLDGLSIEEGKELFVAMARARFGDTQPPVEVQKAVEKICKETGGHPLAIKLLAKKCKEGTAKEIEGMLKGIIDYKIGDRTQRLSSLKVCFEYSFNNLDKDQQELLSNLTLFESPFPSSAIEKIFGVEKKILLLELYDRSMIKRIDSDEYVKFESEYWLYHFHPMIGEYLQDKLGEEGKRDLEEKYGEQFPLYYYRLLKETYNAIGTKEHVLSLERFNVIWQGKDNDFDKSMRLAKDRSVASGISSFLGSILTSLGIYDKALEYLKKALAIHEELRDKVVIARDYGNIGSVLLYQGNYDEALEYLKKALAIHEELQDKVAIAMNYAGIGVVLRNQGKYVQTEKYHKKSLKIHKELRDKVGMANDYRNIGNVLDDQGNHDEALEYHKKALAIHEELNDRVAMALDYTNIGIALDNQGNHDEALEYHKKALAIEEELEDKVGMARSYTNFGNVLQHQGNHDEALEYHKKALAIEEELEDKVGMAKDYGNIGIAVTDQGNHDEALQFLKKALAIHEELNDRVAMALDYRNIGVVLYNQRNYNEALEYQKKALAIHEELNDRVAMALDYTNIGVVHRDQGNYDEALEYLKKASAIEEELEDKNGQS